MKSFKTDMTKISSERMKDLEDLVFKTFEAMNDLTDMFDQMRNIH